MPTPYTQQSFHVHQPREHGDGADAREYPLGQSAYAAHAAGSMCISVGSGSEAPKGSGNEAPASPTHAMTTAGAPHHSSYSRL